MKIADFLTKILPATAFPDAAFQNDLTTALAASGLKDVEVPDSTIDKFNAVYMTADRAKNDAEIGKVWKGKMWGYFADDMEKEFKGIISLLPQEAQTKYYEIPADKANGIYDRLKVLKDGVSALHEKGSGEDVKTAAERHRKVEKELRDKITEFEAKVKAQQDEFAVKETGIKINYALRSKLIDQLPKLDPALIKTQEQKDFIIDSTIHNINSNYLLEFDKDKPTAITFLNKDRSGVFEGNTEVTLDQYLEKKLEPYTVKNNSNGNGKSKETERKVVTTEKTSGLTLKEMRAAAPVKVASNA